MGLKQRTIKSIPQKIAMLLRAGMIPMAYVYPADMRSTRDLLRRRMYFVHKRSELLAHIQNTRFQYNLPDFQKRIERIKSPQPILNICLVQTILKGPTPVMKSQVRCQALVRQKKLKKYTFRAGILFSLDFLGQYRLCVYC